MATNRLERSGGELTASSRVHGFGMWTVFALRLMIGAVFIRIGWQKIGPAGTFDAEGYLSGGGGSGYGSDGDEPDYGGWVDGVGSYDGTVDETGSESVTVEVGAHDVVEENGTFESELTEEAGHTFEHTFEEERTYEYACEPHRVSG